MKSVIAFLFGISFSLNSAAIPVESSTVVTPELDWDDDSADADSQYNGLIVQVYKSDEGAPIVALGSEFDGFDTVYCLSMIGLFQSTDYNVTTGAYTEVPDSEIALKDCTVTQTTSTQFDAVCNVGDGTLSFAFTFTQDAKGDNGLEYIISLADYTLISEDAKLVIVQSISDCSEKYDIDSWDAESDDDDDSDNDGDDEGDEEGEDNSDTVDGEDRRRLTRDEGHGDDDSHDHDHDEDESSDDDDDSSSDEEGEIDVGFSRFVSNGQAMDKCDGNTTNIESAAVQQTSLNQIHLVFAHFDCDLVLDPFYGLDASKYEEAFPEFLNKGTANPKTVMSCIAFILSMIIMIN